MFKYSTQTITITMATCTNCEKTFVYEWQKECQHCDEKEEYISLADIPF